MSSRSVLLATLLLLPVAAANPVISIRDTPVTLPMVKRMNFTGAGTIAEHDLQRLAALKARAHLKLSGRSVDAVAARTGYGNVPVTNQIFQYIANVSRPVFYHVSNDCN